MAERLKSLDETEQRAHVDFIGAKVDHGASGQTEKPWFSYWTTLGAGNSDQLSDAIRQLEAAGREVVSIQPVIAGFGRTLLPEPYQTSSLGVMHSQEVGYGYSYTQFFMILSRDI